MGSDLKARIGCAPRKTKPGGIYESGLKRLKPLNRKYKIRSLNKTPDNELFSLDNTFSAFYIDLILLDNPLRAGMGCG